MFNNECANNSISGIALSDRIGSDRPDTVCMRIRHVESAYKFAPTRTSPGDYRNTAQTAQRVRRKAVRQDNNDGTLYTVNLYGRLRHL